MAFQENSNFLGNHRDAFSSVPRRPGAPMGHSVDTAAASCIYLPRKRNRLGIGRSRFKKSFQENADHDIRIFLEEFVREELPKMHFEMSNQKSLFTISHKDTLLDRAVIRVFLSAFS